ncbi:MAG: hypothetical protein HY547_01730 [Elusimicrobia bacterium]|nr:hypothetical protein [Elusimicrobiota bacterium]
MVYPIGGGQPRELSQKAQKPGPAPEPVSSEISDGAEATAGVASARFDGTEASKGAQDPVPMGPANGAALVGDAFKVEAPAEQASAPQANNSDASEKKGGFKGSIKKAWDFVLKNVPVLSAGALTGGLVSGFFALASSSAGVALAMSPLNFIFWGAAIGAGVFLLASIVG